MTGSDRPPRRTALVTGANRGIGLAVAEALAARGMAVLLGARDAAAGAQAAAALAARGHAARALALDLSRPGSVDAAVAQLAADGVHVDVLVNNAGVYPQGGVLSAPEEAFREAMEVHLFGPLRLCRALVPAMQRAGWGRVVNVSSGSGSFGEGLEGPAPYCISKAALDALTLKLSGVAGPTVKVNAACPGWVRTRMGGEEAPRSVERGAEGIVWLATLPDDGPSGGFFRDGRLIPW
ncbi:SDR family NAD(P)-dependent oxidoreductase [Anaeromyxobacter sp. PSR-1]|uniref:SDR family NAD(P)-dependent oxidoreductase n=1 Tax=unclassified Anaeromyxobacter TaxID=2620896 RepID=UPI0005DCFC79|nr:SDR family NAD(P)-dependent oxidoreductase [Anaeromyxobacter sp. PSR-1]GAO04361.1 3-oxoacyl-[acyl-carrier-protein] reductase FabG [Anaeromyxobacter sp. PSR-1]